jgi:hypothetical protein
LVHGQVADCESVLAQVDDWYMAPRDLCATPNTREIATPNTHQPQSPLWQHQGGQRAKGRAGLPDSRLLGHMLSCPMRRWHSRLRRWRLACRLLEGALFARRYATPFPAPVHRCKHIGFLFPSDTKTRKGALLCKRACVRACVFTCT